MFWKSLKWGATAALLAIFCLALLRAGNPTDASPGGAQANDGRRAPRHDNDSPPKKFNF